MLSLISLQEFVMLSLIGLHEFGRNGMERVLSRELFLNVTYYLVPAYAPAAEIPTCCK